MTGRQFTSLGLEYLSPSVLRAWLTVHRLHARTGLPVTVRQAAAELAVTARAIHPRLRQLRAAGLVAFDDRLSRTLVPCPVRVTTAKGVGR